MVDTALVMDFALSLAVFVEEERKLPSQDPVDCDVPFADDPATNSMELESAIVELEEDPPPIVVWGFPDEETSFVE